MASKIKTVRQLKALLNDVSNDAEIMINIEGGGKVYMADEVEFEYDKKAGWLHLTGLGLMGILDKSK